MAGSATVRPKKSSVRMIITPDMATTTHHLRAAPVVVSCPTVTDGQGTGWRSPAGGHELPDAALQELLLALGEVGLLEQRCEGRVGDDVVGDAGGGSRGPAAADQLADDLDARGHRRDRLVEGVERRGRPPPRSQAVSV